MLGGLGLSWKRSPNCEVWIEGCFNKPGTGWATQGGWHQKTALQMKMREKSKGSVWPSHQIRAHGDFWFAISLSVKSKKYEKWSFYMLSCNHCVVLHKSPATDGAVLLNACSCQVVNRHIEDLKQMTLCVPRLSETLHEWRPPLTPVLDISDSLITYCTT